MAASKIAQYALIETKPLCRRVISVTFPFSTVPDNESCPLVRAVQEMVALAWGTTLRSGGVRVSVWTRAAYVKTSGLSAAHRRAPLGDGETNKEV